MQHTGQALGNRNEVVRSISAMLTRQNWQLSGGILAETGMICAGGSRYGDGCVHWS